MNRRQPSGGMGMGRESSQQFTNLIICNLLQDNLIFTRVPDIWVNNSRGHKI